MFFGCMFWRYIDADLIKTVSIFGRRTKFFPVNANFKKDIFERCFSRTTIPFGSLYSTSWKWNSGIWNVKRGIHCGKHPFWAEHPSIVEKSRHGISRKENRGISDLILVLCVFFNLWQALMFRALGLQEGHAKLGVM